MCIQRFIYLGGVYICIQGDSMDKDKTIRVSDEVMQLLTDRKDKSVSMSSAIAGMLDKYMQTDHDMRTDYILRKANRFVLCLKNHAVTVPEFTTVNKIVRISPEVWSRLKDIKTHPDESFNLVLFRLIKATEEPFILYLGKMHSELANKKYEFEKGYRLADMVHIIPTEATESKLVARGSYEIVKTWTEPFSEKYEFRLYDKLPCPDKMAYEIYSYAWEYEQKIIGEGKINQNLMKDIALAVISNTRLRG